MDGDRDGLVDHFERRDADRAAGAVHQFDLRRQQFVDAVAHQGVGLAAADFHQHPGTGDGAADFGHERLRELRVAILVEELHRSFGFQHTHLFQEFVGALGLFGVDREMAKPTCTMT